MVDTQTFEMDEQGTSDLRPPLLLLQSVVAVVSALPDGALAGRPFRACREPQRRRLLAPGSNHGGADGCVIRDTDKQHAADEASDR
jgi:hypothetical protein